MLKLYYIRQSNTKLGCIGTQKVNYLRTADVARSVTKCLLDGGAYEI